MKTLISEKEFNEFKKFTEAKKVNFEVTKTDVQSTMVWNDGPVLKAMRGSKDPVTGEVRGCVICLDEIDQAKTGIMSLQTIAQGKPYYNKKTNEIIEPAPGFCLIATANTKGDGDGMDKFAGAQIMNQAFLERFSIIVEQDYPTVTVEKKILSKHTSDKNFIKLLTAIAKQTRKALSDGLFEQCLTTRRLVQIAKNYEIFKDAELAFNLAIARFDAEMQEQMKEMFRSLQAANISDDEEPTVLAGPSDAPKKAKIKSIVL